MASVEDLLRKWTQAELISGEVANRILEFERGAAPAPPEKQSSDSRPGALEAVLYLGLVVLAVGVFALMAQQWQDLDTWARIVAIGTPTLLVFGIGAYLRLSQEPEMQRGSQAAWFVTVALFAGFVGVFLNEIDVGIEGDSSDSFLLVASATLVVSLALWVFSPSHPQVLALAGSGMLLGQAIGAWSDDFNQFTAGMTIFAIGLVGLALGHLGWLTPSWSVGLFFSVLAIGGPYEAGAGDGNISFELLAGLVACGLIAYGVIRASFTILLVGVGGAFVVLVSFIFEHFSERIGAPTALMVSGGILVAAVLLLALYRSETRNRVTA